MSETQPCTPWEYDILRHASDNGRFVTDEAKVIAFAERGWMHDYGPQVLAGGAHYLVVTVKGREVMNEYQRSLPPPPKPKRRIPSRAFSAWRDYNEMFRRVSFGHFWREVWPSYRYRV